MKYIFLLLLVPSFLLALPRADLSISPDGSLSVSYFNDSGAPLKFTVIGEGWAKDTAGVWHLDQCAIVSAGEFSSAEKGRKEKVGGNKIGRESVAKMTGKYERVVYKIVLEWSEGSTSEWQNPESVVLCIRIK